MSTKQKPMESGFGGPGSGLLARGRLVVWTVAPPLTKNLFGRAWRKTSYAARRKRCRGLVVTSSRRRTASFVLLAARDESIIMLDEIQGSG